uniref:Uncharacterized protein n=1 Tax=Romanomermis culicivorax TaxID=13658 RepID=A0A915J7I4_ROMCU
MPVFLKAGSSKKDSPHLSKRDLNFCLNLMLSAINPSLQKSTLIPTNSLTAAIAAPRGEVYLKMLIS